MPGHKQVAAAKRRERDEAIERYVKTHFGEKGLQGDTLNEYTRADATLIVKKIEAREWTATAVLKAYLHRALVAHQALNAITEGMNALESLFYTLYSTEQLNGVAASQFSSTTLLSKPRLLMKNSKLQDVSAGPSTECLSARKTYVSVD
jgi:hypothetical protein